MYSNVDGINPAITNVWMVLKPNVNSGISTTFPSTGEFSGFMRPEIWKPGMLLVKIPGSLDLRKAPTKNTQQSLVEGETQCEILLQHSLL